MPHTYAEQLESVQTAIATIEGGGQAIGVNGRALTRADLRTLYDREKWLRQRLDRSDRGGMRIRLGVPGR